ncbi:MAG TPA: hypothetical protein VNM91_02955 [Dehalococcoidia bacterium]|nr:hypothetical protein [Dehalococcoidia bacterium]
MDDQYPDSFWALLIEVRERLFAVVPGLLVTIALLVVGLGVGWLARTLVSRGARALGFDPLLERWGLAAPLRRAGILRPPSEALGVLCFWGVFILFASVAVDALLPGAPGATVLLLTFLPSLFAAILIVLIGWLVANFLSQGVLVAAVNARLPEARVLARGVHWAVLLFAVATALTHLGIGKEMVLVAFGITFGGMVFAVSLAFGLGGRHLARTMLERRLRRETPRHEERLTHL